MINTNQDLKKILVLLDNGHGIETKGKRSPDEKLREYKWTRDCARLIKKRLDNLGIRAMLITPEDTDTLINLRVKKVNTIVAREKGSNVICISIHNNAAGDGTQWMLAKGWEAYVAFNASKKSKELANCLYEAANELGVKTRNYSPSMKFWTKNLGMCRDTKCPAVLTENLFMDNKEEMLYLLSQEGMEKMVNLHVLGIKKYFKL